ncbi:unnamed protein product [Phaedon cochleariae]|uniref:N-acylneuraminate cytidylyltransferase n=1 Tax=Phaedon cochleariae TaxID=80249 RepID=A0A9P0DH44_PHACE|nr:unnamed protein product [Phaedon cochleariae]
MYLTHILLISTVVNSVPCCENYARTLKLFGNPHVAVLILARGGSKGIKLKNLSKIGNLTLLEISLSELHKLVGVNSIWVSTDHDLIANNIENGDVNIHWRSTESASDTASSLEAVQEFLQHHREVDILGLIQCTSPFVKSFYLQKGVDAMKYGKECSFSGSRASGGQKQVLNVPHSWHIFGPIETFQRLPLIGRLSIFIPPIEEFFRAVG